MLNETESYICFWFSLFTKIVLNKFCKQRTAIHLEGKILYLLFTKLSAELLRILFHMEPKVRETWRFLICVKCLRFVTKGLFHRKVVQFISNHGREKFIANFHDSSQYKMALHLSPDIRVQLEVERQRTCKQYYFGLSIQCNLDFYYQYSTNKLVVRVRSL